MFQGTGIKVFPPPDDMEPNVVVIVKLPPEIYTEIEQIPSILETFRHAVWSVTEQELNIASSYPAKVFVIIEESRVETKKRSEP